MCSFLDCRKCSSIFQCVRRTKWWTCRTSAGKGSTNSCKDFSFCSNINWCAPTTCGQARFRNVIDTNPPGDNANWRRCHKSTSSWWFPCKHCTISNSLACNWDWDWVVVPTRAGDVHVDDLFSNHPKFALQLGLEMAVQEDVDWSSIFSFWGGSKAFLWIARGMLFMSQEQPNNNHTRLYPGV